jgi:hypothetical protein
MALSWQERERVRTIWAGIVDYANADFMEDDGAIWRFEILLRECIGSDGAAIDLLQLIPKPEANDAIGDLENPLRYWAIHFQPAVRHLLNWLCVAPTNQFFGLEAVRFLEAHKDGMHFGLHLSADTAVEQNTLRLTPYLRECESAVAPICRFVFEQLWRAQEEKLSLAKVIPVRKCDREDCLRFKLPGRNTSPCFCSDSCRATVARRRKPLEEKAAYQREYRRKLKESQEKGE